MRSSGVRRMMDTYHGGYDTIPSTFSACRYVRHIYPAISAERVETYSVPFLPASVASCPVRVIQHFVAKTSDRARSVPKRRSSNGTFGRSASLPSTRELVRCPFRETSVFVAAPFASGARSVRPHDKENAFRAKSIRVYRTFIGHGECYCP